MKDEPLLAALQAWGCDVDGAQERFMGNTALYLRCLCLFSQDENFEQLHTAVAQNRLKDAFEAAHALKGVAANLGLRPLLPYLESTLQRLRTAANKTQAETACAVLDKQTEKLKAFIDATMCG